VGTSLVWNNDVLWARDGPRYCLPPLSDKERLLEGIHPARIEGINWGQ
jgi:hypothetical protein